MNNYINKHSLLYIEQINYLSGPLVYYHIIFPEANRVDLDQAAACSGSALFAKALKGVSLR